ncbi:hypothetical protein [Niallia nealsonii]|uniref:Uncharacterized protein n=1 Tax=Niallia nealsonii TaxID=115979 RepID=A0A2N0Z0D3_9BACI|nr:hypothetical protein [Niallia nealsonii]PKG22959.1 hypothetical protein CWS01_14900 [Niallia nealsonii]
MKKELLFAFAAFFFMSLSAITGVYALEKEEMEKIVQEKSIDFAKDGSNETVQLKGITIKEESNFFKELSLEVKNEADKTNTIPLEGGYKPTLETVDINGDQIKEIFITVFTNKKLSKATYYLYSVSKGNVEEIALPETPSISSQFKPDYKAELSISGQKTYLFNLYSKKDTYEKLGLYHNGQLNEPTELIVQPFSPLTVITYHEKPALKGKQKISGIAPVDTIAFLETIWTKTKKGWKLEKMTMKEISHHGQ